MENNLHLLKYWSVDKFDISTYNEYLCIRNRKNVVHNFNSGDNTGLCNYTYNELGFRGESIKKDGFKIMSLGCSITEGVGVDDNESWLRQFSKLIPNSVDLNFGTLAASNDFILRCLITYFDLIKPNLVLILYTFPHRREIYSTKGNLEPYIPTHVWGYLKETEDGRNIQSCMNKIQNENEDLVNWYKNHLTIKYFLENKKCNWLWNGSILNYDFTDNNRYDADGRYRKQDLYLDIGRDNDHPGPKHHQSYANQLYSYLVENRPNYLL